MSEDRNPSTLKKEPSSRLFVGSLPYKFTEGELLELFVPFGRIISLKIMHNPWGRSRGLGFVEFDNVESAINAKNKLHNYQMQDRSIIVDFAKPDPLKTPEGQQRHLEAQSKKVVMPVQKFTPKISKPIIKPVFGTVRQSVYDQRTHHSRIGAKFAAKSRHKIK